MRFHLSFKRMALAFLSSDGKSGLIEIDVSEELLWLRRMLQTCWVKGNQKRTTGGYTYNILAQMATRIELEWSVSRSRSENITDSLHKQALGMCTQIRPGVKCGCGQWVCYIRIAWRHFFFEKTGTAMAARLLLCCCPCLICTKCGGRRNIQCCLYVQCTLVWLYEAAQWCPGHVCSTFTDGGVITCSTRPLIWNFIYKHTRLTTRSLALWLLNIITSYTHTRVLYSCDTIMKI